MNDPYGAFRLDFEQQQKRAKDLLKAARSGDAAALARFRSPPKLAEAQWLIARELRFENWAALKHHIAALAQERAGMGASVPDADLRTLHIRCGSDLEVPLRQAGFHGDFLEHGYPYSIGPVLERDERRLMESADYERVVIWSEGDVHDQLVLIRLLGHFAQGRRPPRLELINRGDFPGATRFIGLGQLPPEALRLLWATRRSAGAAQLQLGLAAWRALANPDPRPLAAIMRTGTPALPLLARALDRHLRELPSVRNGLSLSEQLALALLADGPENLNGIFTRMNRFADPLPGQGDLGVRDRVLAMEKATRPVFTRRAGRDSNGNERPPWTDVLAITDLGRAVLRGEVDFRSLDPPLRWVGGVKIGAGHIDWRWDEALQDAVRGPQGPSTS
ncbi:MAG TPA: hypothetical protein VMC02_09465 [Steroidobacteraceae bacterium]|nr:hypothetical protein [Steroidobacteraceae bacterium]